MVMSSAISRSLQKLDQFRVVSSDLTKGTLTGGIFTILAYFLLLVLFLAELGAFLRASYSTNIVMDENQDKLMRLNFDILMYDLPCKYLQLGVWDKFGEEKLNSTASFTYTTIDHGDGGGGSVYSTSEIETLEKEDERTDISASELEEIDADWSSSSDHFKHSELKKVVSFHDFTFVNFFAGWCVHCRRFSPVWATAAAALEQEIFTDQGGRPAQVKFLKVNCVDFASHCTEARIEAFPMIRLYKRDGSFEAFRAQRDLPNLKHFLTQTIKNSNRIYVKHHYIFSEGCQVSGVLEIPRVPGHFHLQAVAKGSGQINLNPAYTNVSHKVNHLSFGRPDAQRWAESLNIPSDVLTFIAPLDGKSFAVERFHEAPQHYLKVVSTHARGQDVFYQMTHTDRVRKHVGKSIAPRARFSYDFSPLSVVIKSNAKPWYEFLTSLFAILGGTYTILELCSGAVDTVHCKVKESLGKAA